MRTLVAVHLLSLALSFSAFGAKYIVKPGKLHRKGKIFVTILPDAEKFRVKMDYQLRKKEFVPVPSKLLEGSTVMDFPPKFKTEAGYKELERVKDMETPKAHLHFTKRGTVGNLKDAYFFEVAPKNKKTRVDIIYHPSLPSVGWYEVEITFLSKFPILDGYKVDARIKE